MSTYILGNAYYFTMSFVDQDVKQYLSQFITIDIDTSIRKGMENFIHAVGTINANVDDKGKGLVDTILINVENQAIISGIKTYTRKHYYFDFIWAIPRDMVLMIDEKPGVIDTFESVFKSLYGHLICAEVAIDKKPFKLIFEHSSTVFAIDLTTNMPQILHKYTILSKKKHELDVEECWKDVNETKFLILGTRLTVKQFLLSKYLMEYVKLIKIYHLDLKKVRF